jgi:hypothetical protein
MKTLGEQIEEMRAHVRGLVSAERAMVKALGDELRRSDEGLLHSIRTVAAEHEKRRASIVGELQALAAKTGLLPDPDLARRSVGVVQHRGRPSIRHHNADGSLSLQEEVSHHVKSLAHWHYGSLGAPTDLLAGNTGAAGLPTRLNS